MTLPERGRSRVIITGVTPQLDGGRYPVKRVQGDVVRVEANIFTDGHDRISGMLQYREVGADTWLEVPLVATHNDRWHATFTVDELGFISKLLLSGRPSYGGVSFALGCVGCW